VKWVRIVVTLVALAAVATATKPRLAFDVAQAAMLEQGGDAARGRLVFDAGDRASCHASPRQPDWLRLGGGLALDSPFGIVFPPNISPDPNDGIGRWRTIDLANALMSGVSSDGRHFYPAYLRTLPPSQGERRNTTCRFPSRSHAVQHRSGARSGMELGALLVDAVCPLRVANASLRRRRTSARGFQGPCSLGHHTTKRLGLERSGDADRAGRRPRFHSEQCRQPALLPSRQRDQHGDSRI
jgi:hypothetical protein